MLWVVRRSEEHYRKDGEEKTRMVLSGVYRFQTGDAAMKRFGWTPEQLGLAEMQEGLTFIGDRTLRHTFTTAHAMPEKVMMEAIRGFKLELHQIRDGEDFVKVWHLPPGREEIMRVIERDWQR